MQKDRKTALLDPNPAPPRRCFRHWIHHRSAIIWTGGRPLGLSGTANSYSRWIRFRGAGQPTFEAFLSVASANPKNNTNSNARARVAWADAGYCAFRESSLSPIPGHPTGPRSWRRCGSRVRPHRLPALCAVLGQSVRASSLQRREGLRLGSWLNLEQDLRHY